MVTAIVAGMAAAGVALLAGGAVMAHVTVERIMQFQAGEFDDLVAVSQRFGGGW